MKKFISLLLVLCMSVALCACKGGEAKKNEGNSSSGQETVAGEPTYGGSVTVGMTQDLVSLDPHVTTDAGTKDVVFNIYEGLMKATSDGDLEPAVASDYTISEDAKTYTFTLRDGITFHDGSTVTVDDIKYSLERYAEIQGESTALFNLESIEIVDDSTVEFVNATGTDSDSTSDLIQVWNPATSGYTIYWYYYEDGVAEDEIGWYGTLEEETALPAGTAFWYKAKAGEGKKIIFKKTY